MIVVQSKTVWVAEDGTEFETKLDALNYDEATSDKLEDRRKKFFVCSYGKKLLEEHALTSYGVWEVRGEDANPDMGGTHYMPHLGTFEGRLSDIVDYAVMHQKFWQWGGGGEIIHVKIDKLPGKGPN